jgi:hypothetical protein
MKQYTIEDVKKYLATNQKWVEGAIVKLYELQTADEQKGGYTSNKNNVGFNAFDAKTLSYYAEWIKSGKNLSGKYLAKAFDLMPKYAAQILAAINQKVEDQILQDEVTGETGDSYYCQEEANAMLQN